MDSITCPMCGKTSHDLDHVVAKYCGTCEQFLYTVTLSDEAWGFIAGLIAAKFKTSNDPIMRAACNKVLDPIVRQISA